VYSGHYPKPKPAYTRTSKIEELIHLFFSVFFLPLSTLHSFRIFFTDLHTSCIFSSPDNPSYQHQHLSLSYSIHSKEKVNTFLTFSFVVWSRLQIVVVIKSHNPFLNHHKTCTNINSLHIDFQVGTINKKSTPTVKIAIQTIEVHNNNTLTTYFNKHYKTKEQKGCKMEQTERFLTFLRKHGKIFPICMNSCWQPTTWSWKNGRQVVRFHGDHIDIAFFSNVVEGVGWEPDISRYHSMSDKFRGTLSEF